MKFTSKHKSLILSFILLFFSSCDIQKKAIKSKTDTQTQNDIVRESTTVTEEKREGGAITTAIIPIEERERDDDGNFKELIETIKDRGLTRTVYYKPDGRVDVECTADEIWTRIEQKLNERDNSVIDETTKAKDKETTHDFDSSVILYGFLGLGFMLAIISFFGFRFLNQNSKVMTKLLERA